MHSAVVLLLHGEVSPLYGWPKDSWNASAVLVCNVNRTIYCTHCLVMFGVDTDESLKMRFAIKGVLWVQCFVFSASQQRTHGLQHGIAGQQIYLDTGASTTKCIFKLWRRMDSCWRGKILPQNIND